MKPLPEYCQWSSKAVEKRVLEAAETLMLCPKARGPKAFGSSMPEPLRRVRDGDVPSALRYRRVPGPAALDQMAECWDWINALDSIGDRTLIYDWAQAKCKYGHTLRHLAARNGICTRTLRRKIQRICIRIASDLNRDFIPIKQSADDQIETDRTASAQMTRSNITYSNHWRASNTKPVIDTKNCKERIIHV